jgi:glucose-6-phosphate 1-epimerase
MNYSSRSVFHSFLLGEQNSPKIKIWTLDGASAEIYIHGAQITSWIPANGVEKLFLSKKSNFGNNASIRGGVPIIFPQFSDLGPLPKHGFARRMEWQPGDVNQSEDITAVDFFLSANLQTRQLWPFSFNAALSVALSNTQLQITLKIINTGDVSLSFTSAMHTYLAVEDINHIKIDGLGDCPYIDTTQMPHSLHTQKEKSLLFTGEVDRIYPGAPSKLRLFDGQLTTSVESQGFPDVVVWNPWKEKTAMLNDMEPDGYLHMVCIEAAAIQSPVVLAPSQTWAGSQILTSL